MPLDLKTVLVPSEQLQVARITPLNHNIFETIIEFSGPTPIRFLPGQYLDIHIDGKAYPYSIAADINSTTAAISPSNINKPNNFTKNPAESIRGSQRFQLHIGVLENNTNAQKIIEHLRADKPFQIAIPKGNCYLESPENGSDLNVPLLIIVASTGFAQAKSLIEHCIYQQPEQPIHLYWGVRHQEDFYLLDTLEQWTKKLPNFNATLAVSNELPTLPGIRHGNIDSTILEDHADLSTFKTFICGSPTMVYAVTDSLKKRKLNMRKTYSDVFDYMPRHTYDELQAESSN